MTNQMQETYGVPTNIDVVWDVRDAHQDAARQRQVIDHDNYRQSRGYPSVMGAASLKARLLIQTNTMPVTESSQRHRDNLNKIWAHHDLLSGPYYDFGYRKHLDGHHILGIIALCIVGAVYLYATS